jgi:MFS family permease
MLDIQKRLSIPFLALLSLPATAMGFALSVQISALSWILGTKYNLDIHDIGLVWAAGPIAGILGQVIVGIVSDNVWFWGGRRRPFILIGGVLAALMLLALPNIDGIAARLGTGGLLGVALVVALTLDLSINISFNPTRSIIADVTPEGTQRTKGYTWMQTVSGTFGVLAYGIGAWWDNYVLIYFGVVLVLLCSLIPPFFITEPRVLPGADAQKASAPKTSFGDILMTLQPLWGFFLYAVYAMALRLLHIEVTHAWVEIACAVLTLGLIVKVLLTPEDGRSKAAAGHIGFQKVLAAHAFTWLGVQTMFVYMFSYVQAKMPAMNEVDQGRVVSLAFLILSAVAAVLPAFVLEPITERIGRVRTHLVCMAIMAVGYAGVLFFGHTPAAIYALMLVLGVGWGATVSLPFAIMSQKVEQSRMGLYMGLFNLSVVLPQLVASLGVGEAVSRAADKGLIFVICTASLATSALAWTLVKENREEAVGVRPVPGGSGH